MTERIIITRTAVKAGEKVSTGRIFDGKTLKKFSTDIITSVKCPFYCDDLKVYYVGDKNNEKYTIIQLNSRAILIDYLTNKNTKEITGIGLDPTEEKITSSVSLHPVDSKILYSDMETISIKNITTVKGNKAIVIAIIS
ncbi:MAG: hypothetical protein K6B70_00045 [Clostridia bacterium]|nr:hypothetical protein [Clostridia bacterium]